jgi:hypothetical protein
MEKNNKEQGSDQKREAVQNNIRFRIKSERSRPHDQETLFFLGGNRMGRGRGNITIRGQGSIVLGYQQHKALYSV